MRRYGLLKKIFLKYKYLNEEKAKPGPHDYFIVLDNLKPDFNIGKIFRTADAMGARGVYLINTPFFNVFPSRGSFKHVPAVFVPDFKTAYNDLRSRGYSLFTFEPGESESLLTVEFPQKCAFVLGHEEFGVSFDRREFSDVRGISIPQYGKVQSLNVSVAASLTMFEYVRQITCRKMIERNRENVEVSLERI